MKKRIVIFMLFALLLTGCSKENKNKESNRQQNTQVTDSNQQEKNKADTETQKLTQEQFIVKTFSSYGYTPPAPSNWIIKQEGKNKVVVIIKEPVKQGKPNISKLIFLWNGSSDKTQVLFVLVNNKVMYGNE